MPPLADTVLVVRELIGRPGTSRQLDLRMPTPDGLSDEIVRIGDEVTVSGVLESVVDGLLLRGTVRAPARVACVRCLAERDMEVDADVVELFARQTSGSEAVGRGPTSSSEAVGRGTTSSSEAVGRGTTSSSEAIGRGTTSGRNASNSDVGDAGYEIIDDTIDLQTLLRDALAAARPSHPLCRPDCAGLCATCGADRNVAPCDGHPEQRDPRWSALAGLDLPDP